MNDISGIHFWQSTPEALPIVAGRLSFVRLREAESDSDTTGPGVYWISPAPRSGCKNSKLKLLQVFWHTLRGAGGNEPLTGGVASDFVGDAQPPAIIGNASGVESQKPDGFWPAIRDLRKNAMHANSVAPR